MPSLRSRRLLRHGLVAVAVLLLALGGTVAVLILHSPGNISHPNVEFVRTTAPPRKPPPVVSHFEWPRYGYDAARTRYFPGGHLLAPPLRVGWKFDDGALIEFPPVMFQTSTTSRLAMASW